MSSLPPPRIRRPNIDTQTDVKWVPNTLLTPQENAWLTELLRDAAASHRITGWWANFVSDMTARHRRDGINLSVSTKQWEQLRRIERAIHATN